MHQAVNSVRDSVEKLGFVAATTSGMSMYPMLRHQRDCVVIKKAEGELKRWDVALYESGGRLVLHRVLKVKGDCYVIRGDNCTSKEYVKKEDVIGVLDNFTRNGKTYHCQSSKAYRGYCILWSVTAFLRVTFKKLWLACYKLYKKSFKRN